MYDRLRTILLLAAVFLLGASPALAQKKSLAELTAEDVQARVKLYLESRGQDVELAEVVVDAKKIRLRKGDENVYTLEWAYSPAFGELPPAMQKAVERRLQVILEEVLNKFRGGLVARGRQEKLTYRFVQGPAQARPVPLAKLTSPMVRGQVDRFLVERPALVKEIKEKVMLKVTNLDYRKPSDGLALVWVVPRREPLSIKEEVVIGRKLLAVLIVALGQYQGGLISPKDLRALEPKMKIDFVNQAAAAPKTPKTQPPRPAYHPVWRLVCGCCGSCWVVEWVPSPGSNAPAGPATGPERLGAPKPAAYLMPAGEPIVVERAPILLPAKVAGHRANVVGAGTIARVQTKAWELRLATDSELVDDYPKDALACYARGRAAYLRRGYGEARAYLTHAVKLNGGDARFWYFKALAELAMERRDLANASALHGKELEGRGLPAGASIRQALQGVPEAAREFLAAVRTPAGAQPVASAR
jgi:hypothetical protein